ncbi:MAG TPA: hypothetical protein PKE58_16505 [Acidobacteriota bacterium]|nr:hypothetical protein [Acidobacteriota bacterium]
MKKRHELGFKGGLFQVPEFKEKDTCHKAPVNPAGALDFANQRTVRNSFSDKYFLGSYFAGISEIIEEVGFIFCVFRVFRGFVF